MKKFLLGITLCLMLLLGAYAMADITEITITYPTDSEPLMLDDQGGVNIEYDIVGEGTYFVNIYDDDGKSVFSESFDTKTTQWHSVRLSQKQFTPDKAYTVMVSSGAVFASGEVTVTSGELQRIGETAALLGNAAEDAHIASPDDEPLPTSMTIEGATLWRGVSALGAVGFDLPSTLTDFTSGTSAAVVAVPLLPELADDQFVVDTFMAFSGNNLPGVQAIKDDLLDHGNKLVTTLGSYVSQLQNEGLLAQPLIQDRFGGGFLFDATVEGYYINRDEPNDHVPESMRESIDLVQIDYLLYLDSDRAGSAAFRLWAFPYTTMDGSGEFMFLYATPDMEKTLDDPQVRRIFLSIDETVHDGISLDMSTATLVVDGKETPILPAEENTPAPTEENTPAEGELGLATILQTANLRAGGTTDDPVVGKAQPGTTYPVIDIAESGWYGLSMPDGTTAYISPKMVTFESN